MREEPHKTASFAPTTRSHASLIRADTLTRHAAWDHDRLDGLLGEATRQVEDGCLLAAASLFRAFDTGLRQHIRVEEEILFPLFETQTGLRRGLTAGLRAEHREIEAALERMRLALDLGDASEYASGLTTLYERLGPHHQKEESVLYPTTDDLLDADARRELVDRIARF